MAVYNTLISFLKIGKELKILNSFLKLSSSTFTSSSCCCCCLEYLISINVSNYEKCIWLLLIKLIEQDGLFPKLVFCSVLLYFERFLYLPSSSSIFEQMACLLSQICIRAITKKGVKKWWICQCEIKQLILFRQLSVKDSVCFLTA